MVGQIGDRYYDRTGSAGARLYVKTTDGGDTGWVAYDGGSQAIITATSSQLNSSANPINTTGKLIGLMVYNTTTNNPVWATGTAPSDIWVDGVGTTAHIPS